MENGNKVENAVEAIEMETNENKAWNMVEDDHKVENAVEATEMDTNEIIPQKDLADQRAGAGDQNASIQSTNSSFTFHVDHDQSITWNIQPNELKKLQKAIYKQISNQIIAMMKATMNNEEEEVSILASDAIGEIGIVNIRGDGNCLFGSLAHQLFYSKLNGKEHKQDTNQLRTDVVRFINTQITQENNVNADTFKYLIKGRLLESADFQIVDLEKDIHFFLNVCLQRNGFWGGSETLKAVSMMYSVNILTFLEKDSLYFANTFNIEYSKTLCIVYRVNNRKLKKKMERNHYDSVTNIDQDTIQICMEQLAHSTQQKAFEDSVIVLDE